MDEWFKIDHCKAGKGDSVRKWHHLMMTFIICTKSFGSPGNPAVLLIMGTTSPMIWWETELCKKLVNKGSHVIRYDNRDTGKSTCYPPGEPGYTFEDLADDIAAVLDAYGIDKAIIMDMPVSGMLAQMIALRHLQRVSGVALLSSMYFVDGVESLPYSSDEVSASFEQMAKFEPPKDTDGLVEVATQQWRITNQSKRPHDEDHIRKMNRMDIEYSDHFDSRINHSYVQVTGDELDRIAEIAVPALMIHGTDDVVISYVHGEMLAKTIPHAALLTMHGVGHELHPLDYDNVIEAIFKQFC